MGTTNRAAARADFELDKTRGDIKDLTEAWKGRHQLQPGTPEYVAALETEEGLIRRIWRRLRADSPPLPPASTED